MKTLNHSGYQSLRALKNLLEEIEDVMEREQKENEYLVIPTIRKVIENADDRLLEGFKLVGSLSLNPTSVSKLTTDDPFTIVPTILPTNAANKNIIWVSSDTDVVTVANGIVTIIGAGTAVITATTVDGGFSATCNVTVTAP